LFLLFADQVLNTVGPDILVTYRGHLAAKGEQLLSIAAKGPGIALHPL
jgi:hypothetical protein